VSFPREESLKALAHASGFFEAGPNSLFQGNFFMWGQQTQKKKEQAIVYGAHIFQLFIGLFVYSI
jgi:hypothetical protein